MTDLKPDIVMLIVEDAAPQGERAKVLDFGIAKSVSEVAQETIGGVKTSMDAILGTPRYVSPEQCRGGGTKITARSDLYSLGVMLYELLARLAEQRAREATALARAIEEERLRSDPNLRSSARPPLPVYKKKWFWGLTVGGTAATILGATLIGIFARPPALPTTDLPSRRVPF